MIASARVASCCGDVCNSLQYSVTPVEIHSAISRIALSGAGLACSLHSSLGTRSRASWMAGQPYARAISYVVSHGSRNKRSPSHCSWPASSRNHDWDGMSAGYDERDLITDRFSSVVSVMFLLLGGKNRRQAFVGSGVRPEASMAGGQDQPPSFFAVSTQLACRLDVWVLLSSGRPWIISCTDLSASGYDVLPPTYAADDGADFYARNVLGV